MCEWGWWLRCAELGCSCQLSLLALFVENLAWDSRCGRSCLRFPRWQIFELGNIAELHLFVDQSVGSAVTIELPLWLQMVAWVPYSDAEHWLCLVQPSCLHVLSLVPLTGNWLSSFMWISCFPRLGNCLPLWQVLCQWVGECLSDAHLLFLLLN